MSSIAILLRRKLGAVPVEQLAAPLLALGPSDQPGDVVPRGQGGCLRSRMNSNGPWGPSQGTRAWGGEADPVRSVHRLGNGHPEWWADAPFGDRAFSTR